MRGALLAGGLLSSLACVHGHPTLAGKSSLTRRTVDLNSFRLSAASSYTNATVTSENPTLRFMKRETYVETATELVKSIVPGAEFRVVADHYVGSNGIAHVNLKQTANGLDIDNADFNVNVRGKMSPF